MQLQDIGEQGFLKIIQGFCPSGVVGDDGAVLAGLDHKPLVVTTDLMVEAVHFSDRTTSPMDVGWRAAAANLSDLAAMGATPIAITVGLGLRRETAVSWLEKLYQGMTACLGKVPIVGGDVVSSAVNMVAITAFGSVDPERVIRRGAAQVGDAIVITGPHGKSKAGLELLLFPDKYKILTEDPASCQDLIQAHQRPQARLDVLPFLAEFPRVAGMDSSDGLADAVCQICQASGVGAMIDRQALPIPPALFEMTDPATALDWVLYGGEDFELVLCLPWQEAQSLVQNLGQASAIIGSITAETKILLANDLPKSSGITGASGDTSLEKFSNIYLERGFQHF
ncbi:MAG: thiamine-phosphate kinase [Coleofasciculaceae cyanobacterium SM2_1_6]|nr:thiamine-phosphate kinase [Coleofasciculaceae cyanobacterium SM2_1_6]